MRKPVVALVMIATLSAPAAHATCFEDAAALYGVSPLVLRAIQRVENRQADPRLVSHNMNGTADYGLMQINSIWLNDIRRYGYTPEHLMDPCLNVVIAAWILANKLSGQYLTWQAVGRYHSTTPHLRDKYAAKVQSEFIRLGGYGQAVY